MVTRSIVNDLIRDQGITRGLGEKEAQILFEWTRDWAELLLEGVEDESEARRCVDRLCRKATAISRFVDLYRSPESRHHARHLLTHGRSSRLFANEIRADLLDSEAIVRQILEWEDRHLCTHEDHELNFV